MMYRKWFALMAASLLLAGFAQAQDVREIKVRGTDGAEVDASAVKAYISLKEGAALDREAVTRDVRALEKSGRFSYVATEVEQVPGGVSVIYVVTMKPRIRRLEINGANELGNRKVREILAIGVGDPVDDATMGVKAQAVKEAYQKKYYPFVEVKWTIKEDPATGTADVKVDVEEGRLAKVRDIEFTGNENIPPRVLKKAMQQKEWVFFISFFSGSGTYKPDELSADVEALRRVYMNEGYLDVKIGQPEIKPHGEKGIDVYIPVEEGPVYKLGSIKLEGLSLFKETDIRPVVTNKADDVASLGAIERTQQSIQDYYGSRGYISSDVKYDLVPSGEGKSVDVVYRVKEGKLAYIRNINIRGNTRTKDKVIRREITVYPGEIYNQVKVRNSERRLRNLGFFSFANAVPEDTDDPGKFDLAYEVEEQKTGQFLIGAGFSSVDDLIGFAELSQGNFDLFNWPPTGGGQKLKLRGTVGTSRRDIELSFVEPWLFDRKLSLGVDLFQHDRQFLSDDYDQRNTGGRITLGKPLGNFNRINLIYDLEEIDVYNIDESASDTIKEEEGTQLKSAMTLELVHDTRDSAFVPTKGNRSAISGTYAGGPLGGDVEIYGFEGKASQYWPVWFDHVINLRGEAAVVEGWGDEDRVPIFDRLFLGGARTLRGFDYRDVGPKDDQGEPVGGLSSWYTIAEYSIPVVEKVRFASYFDIGMVYDEAYEFDFGDYNSDVGIGIRLDFPGFPIRLDYAWPLEADEFNDRDSGRFQFWIGYAN